MLGGKSTLQLGEGGENIDRKKFIPMDKVRHGHMAGSSADICH